MIARLIVLAALVSSPFFTYGDPPPPKSIFDGETLQGWEGNPEAWRAENGAIVGEIAEGNTLEHNEFLFWENEVHDFDLLLEFRISGHPSANSGIQYRSRKLPDREAAGYQADLDDGAMWLGRIYDENGRALLVERGTRVAISPEGRKWVDQFANPDDFTDLLRAGEWNTYQITAVASHVEIRVNGTLCSVLDDREAGHAEFSGKLALQLHSGPGPVKVEFRDIQLRDLGRTSLPAESEPASAEINPLRSISPVDADGHALDLSFESGSLRNWTAEGDAWQSQPSQFFEPNTPRRKAEQPSTPVGNYWVGESRYAETGTGTLLSKPFKVGHRWASYMVGGGQDINRTRVEIVEAETGKILQQAFGEPNHLLHREIIDFQPVLGKTVFIRLIDDSSEINGHIFFDDFVFHDRKPTFTSTNMAASRLHDSPVLWHLQPNPGEPSSIDNLDAQELVRQMAVNDGFSVELIAAEPEIHQPIAFAFDERGRIWVAEAYSYPNKRPEGEGKDRIVIFEDADGDGSFEKRTVFIEGLNLVSALEVGFGGVWVGAAPELLFIPDTNQDDAPDGPPHVLLDGWGYQDTHETLNSFTWGPDGWLYGLQGVFTRSLVGKPGAPKSERKPLRAGVWRYHPQRHEFEIFATGGSNQWGIDFNEMGDAFMTHCRSFHGGGGTTYIIRNGHYWNQANSDYAFFVSNRGANFAPDLKNYLPSSARYDSGEGGAGKPGSTAVYGGHSHVGTMIYLGDNWPDAYRNHLFTHNLHGQQVNHQINVRQGSGYETFHAGYDMLFAPDPTYLPVDLNYGPDGAVYMIDWCDHQHCHSPVNESWERHNGRMYRMTWTDTWEPKKVDLGALDDAALAQLHTHRSEWYVRTARRLLQERSGHGEIDPTALAALREQAKNADGASLRLRAIWTLHVTGNLEADSIERALTDPVDAVRAWSIRLATQGPGDSKLPVKRLVRLAAEDPSPVVRLAIASAAPTLPDESRWEISEALALRAEDASDRFLPKMIWFNLAPLADDDVERALELAERSKLPTLTDSIHWYAARSPEGRNSLSSKLAASNIDGSQRAVRVAAFSLRNETALEMPWTWPEAVRQLATESVTPETKEAIDVLSALFGDATVLAEMRARLADKSLPLEKREAALDLLKRVNDLEASEVYIDLLSHETLRSEAIPMVGKTDEERGSQRLVEIFDEVDSADQAAILGALTSRPTHALSLLRAVKEGRFDRKRLTSLHLRQMQALDSPQIDKRLDELWGQDRENSEDAQTKIEHYKKVYTSYPMWSVDPGNGRHIYRRSCVACHKLDGEGGSIGPDLNGSWRNGADYFLENIIAPNAVVGTDYQLHVITKSDGSVVSGMVESDTGNTLTVRAVSGTAVVPKSEIQKHEILTQSMMPTGLLEGLSDVEVLELIKYLTENR